MSWLCGEALEDSLVTLLTAADAAKVSALNTEFGDAPVIEAPVEWVTFAEPESIQHWPTGFVVTRSEQASQFNMTAAGAGHQLVRAVLWAGIYIRPQTGDHKRLLHRSLLRYGRLLRELIAEQSGDNSLGAYTIAEPTTQYPDRGVLPSGQMFGVVYVEFSATYVEGKA